MDKIYSAAPQSWYGHDKSRYDTTLVTTLLRSFDVSAQLALFVSQGRLLFPLYRAALHDHHQWLIPRLLPVRRTTGCGLIPLPLHRSEFLTAFPTLLNRGYALSIVCLRLLAWTKDVVFGDECIR